MGSMIGDWPSFDPYNFSQLRPSDPSNPSKMTPTTYHPTHSRTLPPPDQGTVAPLIPKLMNPLIPKTESLIEMGAKEILQQLIHGTSPASPPLIDVLASVLKHNDNNILLVVRSRGLYNGSSDVDSIAKSILTIVITTEAKNILLRNFYERAEDKLRLKRAASEHLVPEHGNKHPRASHS